ncbi:methyltransferase [Variovorax sp. ZT5P49]|uniref:methyltransferase n=2 Tax=unclassified Variovorax TaxID=663243 RepID=UPI003F44AA96
MIVHDNSNKERTESFEPLPHGGEKGESPAEAVMRMAGGFAMTQVLVTAVQSGIADFMSGRECTAEEIGRALHLNARALYRFMRMMVVLDLLVEIGEGRFRLSEAGQLICADHPQSIRERIAYIGAINYPVAGAAIHSLRTGETAFDHVFGKPFFEHLAQEPKLGRAFNGLMQRGIEARIAGVSGAHDFSQARHIVDLGGGNGALLSSILASAPRSTGTIFDLPGVIAEARQRLVDSPLGARMALVEGDLFAGHYPTGADLYILSNIIHDWNDDQAQIILRHCAQAMGPDGELILVEETMPMSVLDSPSTVANDYSMLLLTGGLERSEDEYRALLARSGLALFQVTPFAVRSNDRRRKGHWALLHCRAN